MLESYLRPYYQKFFVDPVSAMINRVTQCSPAAITCIAIISGIAIIPALIMGVTWLACVLLIISGVLDSIDGTLARLANKVSIKGSIFDIVGDRIVEVSVILGLYAVNPAGRAFPVILMLCGMLLCVTTFLVVGIFTKNNTQKSFYYSPGIVERLEAFMFFLAMILLPSLFTTLAIAFAVLMFLTAVIRLMQFVYFVHDETV